ncbi:universal stress protein [Microvirga sp. STS02]|uniref:universal stress protein n=1 Tax=Hymenobacter negativus TaxID=2795026 RepID=UPI0018DC3A65|nr:MULTISPECIES: universal stress protein [Bacteria]MBH8567478.1 universal stress protein [Hymenobacter negativus]MBR7207210.1 universal stress protein [Microvirga sp. STS02]
MKNILVCTDFSPEAHNAFEVALQLAKRTGGRLTLLHVLEEAEGVAGGFSTMGSSAGGHSVDRIYTIKLLETTKRRMHLLRDEAAMLAPKVPVQDEVEIARVGDGILHAINRDHPDLVVLGARGHGAVEHFFVSSTTERVIRLAPCPVLTVKHPHTDFDVQNIVFPSDFAADAASALEGLRQVQADFPNATLHLLHVAAGSSGHVAQQQMEAFAQQHHLLNCQTAEVDAERTSVGIEEYAQNVGADMVVIPTHARSGLSRFLRTSIAETVATHAFPPVLTYHLAA